MLGFASAPPNLPLKGYKLQTEYEFPALSAVGDEKANTRENNAAIMGRIPQKFDEIRGSINDLEGQIQQDPKVALRLDKVVERTLKDGGDSVEVRQWLASEQFWKNAGTAAGVVGTMGAVLGSVLNPEVGILRWIAAGLGIGTAAVQLPDAIIEDRAAQSGRGGAKQVTSLDPDTARGNLVLVWVSLGVAGLDAGLQPEVVAQVVKLPGVARAAMSMTKAQSKVFVASLGHFKGEVTDEVVQKITAAVKGGALEVELPGVGRVKLSELDANQPMRMQGKGENNNTSSRRNLQDHEEFGGHTIERHVGKSENWLRNRAENDPTTRGVASSFRNEVIANRTDGKFVTQNREAIFKWLNNSRDRIFKGKVTMPEPIGIVFKLGSSKSFDSHTAEVVLIRDSSSQGWHILTSYPIP
jgi:hypothetical protein